MNYYIITYRLDSDNRLSRRRWEDFANNRDHAVELLVSYCRDTLFSDDLFPPKIIILKVDEYLSIFK